MIGGIVSISDSNRAPMEDAVVVVDCDSVENDEVVSSAPDIFVPPKMNTVATTGSIAQCAICRRLIFNAVV